MEVCPQIPEARHDTVPAADAERLERGDRCRKVATEKAERDAVDGSDDVPRQPLIKRVGHRERLPASRSVSFGMKSRVGVVGDQVLCAIAANRGKERKQEGRVRDVRAEFVDKLSNHAKNWRQHLQELLCPEASSSQ